MSLWKDVAELTLMEFGLCASGVRLSLVGPEFLEPSKGGTSELQRVLAISFDARSNVLW